MRVVHVVVPDGIDDPARPSGGNAYDRRLIDGLPALGWDVDVVVAHGGWPAPDAAARAALAAALAALPREATVLVDGLVATAAADVLVPAARRLRIVVLVHMALGVLAPAAAAAERVPADAAGVRATEGGVLAAAAAVVTTSAWTRARLLALYDLPPARVHVAAPGVEPAALATGTPAGGALLCVAAVTATKGHDVLVEALARLPHAAFTCACVGALDRDPAFVAGLRRALAAADLDGRVALRGPLHGTALAAAFAAADALVLASRAEAYGMVVTEALARGLPVLASDVGGVPEALGAAADGTRPGLLVPPGDADALARALQAWLAEPALRERLRAAARERRGGLAGWGATAAGVAGALATLAG